jgi:hypothetical protein
MGLALAFRSGYVFGIWGFGRISRRGSLVHSDSRKRLFNGGSKLGVGHWVS